MHARNESHSSPQGALELSCSIQVVRQSASSLSHLVRIVPSMECRRRSGTQWLPNSNKDSNEVFEIIK